MQFWENIKLLYGSPKKEKKQISLEEKKRRIKNIIKISVPLVIFFGVLTYISFNVISPVILFSDSVDFRVGYINRTENVKDHLFLYTYITFPYIYENNPKDRIYIKEAEGLLFVKGIACLPGQTLTVNANTREFYCDGHFIGKGRKTFLNGKKAKLFIYNGKIPEGKYFVLGDKWNSFDSRYWGFVDESEIVAVVHPLF